MNKMNVNNVMCGIFIQDINGAFWNVEDWDNSTKPNAIAVITPLHSFRIALTASPKKLALYHDNERHHENISYETSATLAEVSDFNGMRHTQYIMEYNPSRESAAGWCNAYTFPDGVTMGYLPALGELRIAHLYKDAINVALAKCGGDKLINSKYWSSSYENISYVFKDSGWAYDIANAELAFITERWSKELSVRPFATLEACCGVFIQDINGNLWKTKYWDDSVKPNAIAVITPKHKFRIGLTESPLDITMCPSCAFPWQEKAHAFKEFTDCPHFDCNGKGNSSIILQSQPDTEYAVGWCNAYTFPDGVTKGYLPALGELLLVCQNKTAIDEALVKCGGAPFIANGKRYWSSTLGIIEKYKYSIDIDFWTLSYLDGPLLWRQGSAASTYHARPFAEL